MAARKLQTEIDRTLKKVAEGVELFESIYDKMQASTNQTQKEKLETDLKTQIKKLQRLRDQIKTWVASNDIKDKTALLDNRRLIETTTLRTLTSPFCHVGRGLQQMEKFKACEKEMKTKAFSKEGLTQHAKLDPKAQEKLEVTQWVNNQVEELQLQLEQAEAEIETLQGGGKKKNKAGGAAAERLETLEQLNERRKWHISRLEIILRLLDNGTLPTEKVLGLKEDVQYFVESNMDENFDEDEGIYDELNLDEEEEKFGLANDDDSDESEAASDDLPPRTPSKKHDEESVASSNKRDGSPVLKKATVTLQLRISGAATINTVGNNSIVIQPACSTDGPVNSVDNSSIVTHTRSSLGCYILAKFDTFVRHKPDAVVCSIGVCATRGRLHRLSSIIGSGWWCCVCDYMDSVELTLVSVDIITDSSAGFGIRKAQAPPQSLANGPPQLAPGAIPSAGYSPMPQQAQAYPSSSAPAANAQSSSSSPLPPTQLPQYPPGVKASGAGPALDLEHSVPPGVIPQQNLGVQRPGSTVPTQMPQQAPPARPSAFPGSLSDLVVSFEKRETKGAPPDVEPRPGAQALAGQLLQHAAAARHREVRELLMPKYYVPRNPIQTPAYYPQTPNPILNTAGIFSQLDVETLFYVFYYLPGTYQQYLAAKELKRQSWRFHVKYLTWFQRHSEPQAITEEYEQGVYVYFDWEGSWCQRKKSDFRFEYRYLSED
ncbi:hypothetical protein EVJ58_g2426 [Rhodofomes roseus]|uniref:General negative regulator of transcription subunit n=1 Tax=Rhodofomes roseus TaxID=34475 RepID=A0A4Y9YQR3_9APHY|nr:hypothetical protein EVJ58_g2426 [Rhodofomes roseus]